MADGIVVIDSNEEEVAVVDEGRTVVSEENAQIAEEAAEQARQWAVIAEEQANIATDAVAAVVPYVDEIQTVADNITNINAAVNNETNINTVAGIASDVTTVSSISSSISTVSSNISDVNTVANNISNVNNVSSISSDVTTVSGISNDVTAVAGNATDISAVAANNTNITAVANNATNINAVNANKTNIDAVAGNETNITAVANNATNINAVNANKTNIDAVAGNNTDISAVAADLTNIDAVAADLTNIDNASANAQLARDWAVKMDGLVASEDYSAKYYADQARQAAAGAVTDGVTINRNTDDELQAIGVIDNNGGNALKTWTGTLAQYNAIVTKDNNTLYNITDDNTAVVYEAYTKSETDTLIANSISTLLTSLYPVGAIYIGVQSYCPLATLISGSTWIKVSEGRVLQGSDSNHNAGTTIAAGLPNIKGSATSTNSSAATCYNNSYTGAITKVTISGTRYYSGASNSSSDTNMGIGFDASRSNSIYGNSSTVQPPAYVVNIWQRTA